MSLTRTLDDVGGTNIFGTEVRSAIELVALIEQGIPVRAVDALRRLGDLSEADLGEIIARRTLAHARKNDRLSPEQSDRVVRAIGTYARAHEVFADA
ncbi:MAG TPA: antitoxin Xre-like helix-turn-helix domain-containing protein, partial [Longimicrobiaceae bacterium]|nr:antitoxin Xre-like helix-turn-helix domain-containing protein [Longimicrobiaceae bacterium]